MIKVIHIGDLHLGGQSPEKAAASIEFLLEQLETPQSPAFHPDLIVCTGDTTEKPLHVHNEALKPLLDLVSCDREIVFLQGTPSHEPYGFLQNLRQATGNMITVFDHPGVWPAALGKVRLAALPAINKPILAKWAAELGLPQGEPDDIVRSILIRFSERWIDFKGPKILLGHWTVNGCQTASGQTLYGSDMSIGLDDLAVAGADITLLGHIHKAQTWVTPTLVAYCGSAYACNWGELDKKSFNVIEFSDEPGLIPCIRSVAYPHLPMQKLNVEFTGKQTEGEWEYTCDGMAPGYVTFQRDMEYKVCYSVPKEIASQVDDMKIRVLFRQLGFDLAAVERTIRSTDRQRIADIDSKETTRQQYMAVCAAKDETPRTGALVKCDLIDEKAVA